MELLTQREDLLKHYKVVKQIALGQAKWDEFWDGVYALYAQKEYIGREQYTAGGIAVTCYKLTLEGYEDLYVTDWDGAGLATNSIMVACNTKKGYEKWRDAVMG